MLRVLGEAALAADQTVLRLERKTAALLTFLALEGATPRSRLAGLLWPSSSETTARNNLSQVLRRLRKHTGSRLVDGDDVLSVTSDLKVDAAMCKVAAFEGDVEAALKNQGELLSIYDYDDLPDFADWLYSERERLAQLKRSLLIETIAKLEREGRYGLALNYVAMLLALNPVSEENYRTFMRLTYLAGDRAAALKIYHRCQEVLRRELGVEPLPETAALAREIDRNTLPPAPVAAVPKALPLSVLRPPVLVEREGAWAQLEAAWAAGQAIFICGEPGVGKTRLMLDFVSSKGPYGLFAAHPGDADIPYAFHTRSWRALLSSFPDLRLEPWVRRELSRLLPELSAEAPPLSSEADRLRLYEAAGALLKAAAEQGWVAAVVDDLQYVDAASFEAASYLIGRSVPASGAHGLRTVSSFRSGELSPHTEACILEMVTAGLAVLIKVTPLDTAGVRQLLAELELPWAEPLAKELSSYTGGNPLFITETLKSLLESGQAGALLPRQWPTSGRVKALLHERLQRLSQDALKLAWAAAVAQADFSLELAGAVLGTNPLALAAPWQELEAAQVFSGGRFSHDLLYESVQESVPVPIKTLLHRRCAAYLATRDANPLRVAQHFLEAGEEASAIPLLLAAAATARASFQFAEAADFYGQAATMLERQDRHDEAFEALLEAVVLLTYHGLKGEKKGAVAKLLELAKTPPQRAKAYHAEATLLYAEGEGEACERAARTGYAQALLTDDLSLQAKLLGNLGESLYFQGRILEAAEVYQQACDLCEQVGEGSDFAAALSNVAFVLDMQDRYEDAIPYYHRADELALKHGDTAGRVAILNDFGFSLRNGGFARASVEPLTKAMHLLKETDGTVEDKRRNLGQLGESYAQLGHFALALAHLQEAIHLSECHHLPHGFLQVSLGRVYLELGQIEQAEAHLEAALRQPGLRDRIRGVIWLTRGRRLAYGGEPAEEAFTQAKAYLDLNNNRSGLGKFLLHQSLTLSPTAGLEQARQALDIAKTHRLGDLWPAAETRCAQLLLALGRPAEALHHSTSALDLANIYDPIDFSRAEVFFTHYQALEANHDRCAVQYLKMSRTWVLDTADTKTPPEHHSSFLERNPVNKAVLETAQKVLTV